MRPVVIVAPVVLVLGVLSFVIRHNAWRRALRILFVLSLVAGLGFIGYRRWQERSEVDPLADGEVHTVAYGEVTDVVEATGNIAPQAQSRLTFAVPGELVEITVVTGQEVQEGQVLARLDTEDLELQIDQAEAGLASAQANLQRVQAEARPEDVQVAESNLAQAQINAQELRVTLAASTEQARLSWIQAANALRDAQAAYENIYWDNREAEERLSRYDQELPDSARDAEAQAWRAVENAEAAMEQARLSYEQAQQRQQSSVAGAWSQVNVAQANLDRLSAGASSEEVAAARASVDQAQVSLEMAQAQLERAVLTAPFGGVVATVLAETHSQVSAAVPILVLLDNSSYYVDVEVDEVDIIRVERGQQAQVLLDALPDATLRGEVEEIALSPSSIQGVITYRVRVRVTDLQDAEVRVGMTANVQIVTDRADDVLVVPRRAIRLEEGQAYVQRVLRSGEPEEVRLEEVQVELGLEDPFYVEIRSGVEAGDEIFVPGVIQRNQIQQLFGGGRP